MAAEWYAALCAFCGAHGQLRDIGKGLNMAWRSTHPDAVWLSRYE
jgi:hypothetical protein